jgi:CubicO group peptidase (beta-lactamase class C family)
LAADQTAPPGVVIGLSRSGRRHVALSGSTGPDRGRGDLDRATAFDLASVSKIVLTTAVLRLAEQGRLHLDDHLGDLWPRIGWLGRTSLRRLLWHRAGLWEWQPLYLAGSTPWQTLTDLPPRYPPDSSRHYSDLGFMLLGLVVERVTGQPLDRAVAELVTEPWGLERTRYGPVLDQPVAASAWGDEVERDMVASGQPYPSLFPDSGFAWRQDLSQGQVADGNCFHAFGQVAGHAGLFSTVDDLLALAEVLADPALADRWPILAAAFEPGPDPGQGLGWRLGRTRRSGDQTPVPFAYHTGFTGCAVGLWPNRREAVVMLSNRLLAARPTSTVDLWRRVLWAGGWEAELPLETDQSGRLL